MAYHILDFVNDMIDSFEGDPPDSEFQRGYLCALEEIKALFDTSKVH